MILRIVVILFIVSYEIKNIIPLVKNSKLTKNIDFNKFISN